MAARWEVLCEPVGRNPGIVDKAKAAVGAGSAPSEDNVGGLVIYLTNGSSKQEVSRVAWIRRVSKNPDNKFEDQLATEINKAKAAAEVLNGSFDDSGELQ
jgi:hypothetical protein